MEGFEKIDLDNTEPIKTEASTQSNVKEMRKRRKINVKNKKVLIGVAIAIIILGFGIIMPSYATVKAAKKTVAQAKIAMTAIKNQNIDLADTELKKTRVELENTQKNLHRMFPLAYIPFINAYYNDIDHLLKAGEYGLDASDDFVASVKPYGDVLGLKGQGSFVGGSAETRIQTAVKTMDKVTPKIDQISESITLAQKEIDEVNPGRYPAMFGLKKVHDQLVTVKTMADEGGTFVNEAKPLIKVLPKLLGEPDEKKYLIIFQNDKELRPTGGFITAYTIFRLDGGVIHTDSSNDIYSLDAKVPGKQKAPAPILKYLAGVPVFNLRDSNLSPDYVESMKTFKEMYDKANGPEIDGIIAVDTHALVAAMEILGDVEAGGVKYTTKNDPRCDCPQVIYELERQADQPVNYVRENRKSSIGDLMYAILEKAFSSSPKQYWGKLFQEMINQSSQKHLLYYVYDEEGQKGIEALNAAGRIKNFEGDYIHVNETSFSGAKSNLFVSKTVDQNYKVENDGSIIKTVTIKYKNPHEPSDCNLERGGLCLNADYRNWFRVLVPEGSELIDSKGSEVKVRTGSTYPLDEKLGKTIFEGFVTVRPKGASTVTLTYRLPFKLDKNSVLPLMIQKQPGLPGFEYTLTKEDKELQKFNLDTDKELELKLQ